MAYTCHICGQAHSNLPLIDCGPPYHWTAERANHPQSVLAPDFCVIQGQHFFVRGLLLIPVRDHPQALGFAVWVSHKQENFEKYRHRSDFINLGPFFGWLSSEIKYYSTSTLNLKAMTHYLEPDKPPRIEVEDTAHPLARHQHQGITIEEACQILHFFEGKG